jgi:hypothetical protein
LTAAGSDVLVFFKREKHRLIPELFK